MNPDLNLNHPLAPLAVDRPAPIDDQARPAPVFPWEDPESGVGSAVRQTLAGVLFAPRRFFGGHRAGRGLGAPFTFGLAAVSTGLMLSSFINLAASVLNRAEPWTGWSIAAAAQTAGLVLTPLAVVAGLILQAVTGHLCLMIFASGRGGLPATLRALSYAVAPYLFFPVPLVGPAVAFFWSSCLWVVGLSRLHGVGPGRVVASLLVPPAALATALLAFLEGAG